MPEQKVAFVEHLLPYNISNPKLNGASVSSPPLQVRVTVMLVLLMTGNLKYKGRVASSVMMYEPSD
jgi:hypothetical protein